MQDSHRFDYFAIVIKDKGNRPAKHLDEKKRTTYESDTDDNAHGCEMIGSGENERILRNSDM